jgi:hypothetical protein
MNPLQADALSETMREHDSTAWRAAHVAASRVDQRRADHDGAVHHSKLAMDDARLAELVWSRAPFLLAGGQYAVLQRWLDGLDETRLRGWPPGELHDQVVDRPHLVDVGKGTAHRASQGREGCVQTATCDSTPRRPDRASSGLLDDDDIAEAASALEAGCSAGLLVYENVWAAPFAAAMRRAGGQLVASGRISIQAILSALDAELDD